MGNWLLAARGNLRVPTPRAGLPLEAVALYLPRVLTCFAKLHEACPLGLGAGAGVCVCFWDMQGLPLFPVLEPRLALWPCHLSWLTPRCLSPAPCLLVFEAAMRQPFHSI